MRFARVAGVAVLLAVLASLPSFLSAEGLDNLLRNPGFEEGIADWHACSGNLSHVSEPVHSGEFAASLTTTCRGLGSIYQAVEVSPGSTYELSGWALRNPDDIHARIYLEITWYDGHGGFGEEIGSIVSSDVGSEARYSLLTTGNATAPPDAHSARAKALLDPYSQTPVTAYFDDLSLAEPLPTPIVTPKPTPTATPTPTPTFSPTPAPTPIPTPTAAPIPTPSPTLTATHTPVPEQTPTPKPTPANEGDSVVNEVQNDTPQISATATPAAKTGGMPVPTLSPTQTPASYGQTHRWLHVGIPSVLLLMGLVSLAVAFRVRKRT